MGVKINFDTAGNPEIPSLILCKRSGDKFGLLNNIENLTFNADLENPDGFSFVATKGVCSLWDEIKNFRIIYIPEWENENKGECYFQLTVSLDENDITTKSVEAIHLCEAELSQLNLYDMEINTEDDIEYLTNQKEAEKGGTKFYNPDNEKFSLLHRMLADKGFNFTILHVDKSLWNEVREFSFNDKTIHDCFNEVAEELECHFEYSTWTDSIDHKTIRRGISVYDLKDYCTKCGKREEYMDICPDCGANKSDILKGYGVDTTVFLSRDNLVEEATFDTDTDSVKNCFRLEAADDQMTSAIMSCNPNGSQYLYYLADWVKSDMSDELRDKIESYDKIYQHYYANHDYLHLEKNVDDEIKQDHVDIQLDENVIIQLNKYVDEYNNMMEEDHGFIPGSYDRETNSEYIQFLENLPTEIVGFSKLMESYYDAIDLELYLRTAMMPSVRGVDVNNNNAEVEWNILKQSLLDIDNEIAVDNLQYMGNKACENAIDEHIKCYVDTARFTWDIKRKSEYDVESIKDENNNVIQMIWKGSIILRTFEENEGEQPVSTYGDDIELTIKFNDHDLEKYTESRINHFLQNNEYNDYTMKTMFELSDEDFEERLKRYSLDSLNNYLSICQGCIDVIYMKYGHIANIDDITDEDIKDVEDELEKPLHIVGAEFLLKYKKKREIISKAIQKLEEKIKIIADRDDDGILTGGLILKIQDAIKTVQSKLELQKYVNNEILWAEFVSFRREQTYSNQNYEAEDMGFDNAELFRWAFKFIESANKDLQKSAEQQHSISTTIKGMWSIPEFEPIFKQFKTGNWLRVQVDEEIYKLRLSNYQIDYDDPTHTPVTFTDVMRYGTDMSDIRSILNSASSMATSYGYVERQASKGSKASQFIEDLENEAAVISVASNEYNELIIEDNGLIARDYDRVIGDYGPEQFRITHNAIMFTDDNWDTVKTALGKQYFSKIDENGKLVENVLGYGLRAEYLVGSYLTSGQVVSGDIYSGNVNENNEPTTHINLNDGSFNFADGKFTGTLNDDKTEYNVRVEGEIQATSGVIGGVPIVDGKLQLETVTADQVITNLITGKDGDKNAYIDLIAAEISMDKIISTAGDATIEFVNGIIKTSPIDTTQISHTDENGNTTTLIDFVNSVVNVDTVVTNIIQGKDENSKYYLDLIAGEIAIDKISSSDGKTSIEFIDDRVKTANIQVNQILGPNNETFADLVKGYISIPEIRTDVIKGLSDDTTFIDLVNNKVQTSTIYADQISSRGQDTNPAVFLDLANGLVKTEELQADQAEILKALMGTLVGKSGYILNLSADKVTADDAFIQNIIAPKISVADLKAGNITLTDSMQIVSENGNMVMNGNALQIKGKTTDEDGNEVDYVGVQLGYDTSGEPSLILRNKDGATVVTPEGITSDAIADGLIVNNMVGTGAISKDKLNFNIDTEKDENGNEYLVTNIENVYMGDGGKFGVEYTSFKELTNTTITNLDQKIEDSIIYRIEIESTNGNLFKSRDINTTLICHVFKANDDITDEIDSSRFHWVKLDKDGLIDEIWTQQHNGVKSVTISNYDVYTKATFNCAVDGIFEDKNIN